MCCFSGRVNQVSDTSIFCRMGAKGNQVVIYQMTLDTDSDVAMVLPVPVPEERDESSVQFVDLTLVPDFFEKIDRAFPAPRSKALTFGAAAGSIDTLPVKQVGSYAASFVPRMEDFSRLDPQFRIEPQVWRDLPQYADHGFVVFRLKAGRSKVHPMAFAYPARDRTRITFPTVHIHDGKVHAEAEFDHALYCQSSSPKVRMSWRESVALPGGYVNLAAMRGTVRGEEHVYKQTILGLRRNEDIVVPA